jgi:hypothetical protein
MSVIFGWKQVGATKIGYKSDFCECCKSPGVIDEWKQFTWGHIFGIPLLPLGYSHAWICFRCKQNPLGKSKTSRAERPRPYIPELSTELCHYCGERIMKHPFFLCARCNLQLYP